MLEFPLFFVGLIILQFTWMHSWQKTFLDDSRDRLFDLRDSVRNYMLENNIGLDNNIYLNLRLLINSQIRFLEEISFLNLLNLYRHQLSTKEEFYKLEKSINDMFNSDNPKLMDYADNIRKQSTLIVISHLLKTSIILLSSTFLVTIYIVLRHSIKRMSFDIKVSRRYNSASKKVYKRFFKEEKYLEGLSFHYMN